MLNPCHRIEMTTQINAKCSGLLEMNWIVYKVSSNNSCWNMLFDDLISTSSKACWYFIEKPSNNFVWMLALVHVWLPDLGSCWDVGFQSVALGLVWARIGLMNPPKYTIQYWSWCIVHPTWGMWPACDAKVAWANFEYLCLVYKSRLTDQSVYYFPREITLFDKTSKDLSNANLTIDRWQIRGKTWTKI